jgi:hypothetical protein
VASSARAWRQACRCRVAFDIPYRPHTLALAEGASHVHPPAKAARHPDRLDFHENKKRTFGAGCQGLRAGCVTEIMASRFETCYFSAEQPGICKMTIYNLEEVFVTEGVPRYTFVEPPNYVDILLDARIPGKPIILEGQSGTGKTTAIKHIIQQLGRYDVVYLSARQPGDLENIDLLVSDRMAGFYVIDDFHRLPEQTRENLANIAKLAAEQAENLSLPKLAIIGINQVGSDLIQLVPDIAKRTGIHRILPGTASEIAMLIDSGCAKLNMSFNNPNAIFDEAAGDYWLTQQLCQTTCSMAGVSQTVSDNLAITVDIPRVRERVVNRLQAAYYPAVKEFCRGRRFRPSNDPYYKLLRTVGQQESSVVDLNELANAIPDVRGSINNIKDNGFPFCWNRRNNAAFISTIMARLKISQ